MLNTFYVMYKNEIVTKVSFIKNGSLINIEKFTEHPAIQPFCGTDVSLERVMKFLKRRCFSQARPDAYKILDALGLKEYDPVEIIKITHGHMWEDCTWIRFEGETLTWEDIKNGTC